MPFASTVVNAANADHASRCVCVAPHGCVLCTWLCGIHCVPRRGATALLGMQHSTSAHDNGSNGCSGVGAAGNGLWSSLIRLSSVALCYLSPAPRSVSHPIPSATICLTARTRVHCLHYGAACWAGLLRVHISAVQRWSICSENGAMPAKIIASRSRVRGLQRAKNQANWRSRTLKSLNFPAARPTMVGAQQELADSIFSHMAYLSATLIRILTPGHVIFIVWSAALPAASPVQ